MSTNIQSFFTLTEEEQERLGAEELIQLASEIRNSSAVSAELMLDLLHEQKQTWPPQSASVLHQNVLRLQRPERVRPNFHADISAGGRHTIGLCADGTVKAVGYKKDGRCNVSGWKDIVAVAVGGNHTVGLCADGTVKAVGNNKYGQCNVSGWNLNQPSDLPPGTKGKASWITKFFPFSH